jgi:hypothetical protein
VVRCDYVERGLTLFEADTSQELAMSIIRKIVIHSEFLVSYSNIHLPFKFIKITFRFLLTNIIQKRRIPAFLDMVS